MQPHFKAVNPAACFENCLLSSELLRVLKGTGTDRVPWMWWGIPPEDKNISKAVNGAVIWVTGAISGSDAERRNCLNLKAKAEFFGLTQGELPTSKHAHLCFRSGHDPRTATWNSLVLLHFAFSLYSRNLDLHSYARFLSSDVAQHHIAACILCSFCGQKFHWFWWELCVPTGATAQWVCVWTRLAICSDIRGVSALWVIIKHFQGL